MYIAILYIAVLAFAPSCLCYDTGHHNDVTRNALQLSGYNHDAQEVAGIGNFFVDYYAFQPDVAPQRLPELNAMHFDNIFTLQNASLYWTQLVINARSAIKQAVEENDVLTYIMTMGGTMHTVQDFYTHSNWANIHERRSCSCYRNETWVRVMHSVRGDLKQLSEIYFPLSTYSYGEYDEYSRNNYPGGLPHGDYCLGVNKDSYDRPYFEQSYSFAFVASMEWIHNIHTWVGEADSTGGFLDAAKAYEPDTDEDKDDLAKLIDYVRFVSYTIKSHGEDGHWKGAGSGETARFGVVEAQLTASSSIFKKRYLEQKIHQRWVFPVLYDYQDSLSTAGADESYSALVEYTTPLLFTDETYKPVVVRTVYVNGDDDGIGRPSYYAKVTIDDLLFVEAVQINYKNFAPHWTSIKFIPAATETVAISYDLIRDRFPGSDPVVDINPNGGGINLTFNTFDESLSGDITEPGVYNSTFNSFSTSGSANVTIFVASRKLGGCPTTGLPQPFCPDGAYEAVGAHPYCFAHSYETVPSNPIDVPVPQAASILLAGGLWRYFAVLLAASSFLILADQW